MLLSIKVFYRYFILHKSYPEQLGELGLNTTQLECFLAVSESLNFSRAAEQLKLTQPAVSHQITSLEDELGVKLFWRSSKSVRLTQEGYMFAQYASEIMRLTGLSKARLKEIRSIEQKRLGIGCRNALELGMLRPALKRLRAEEPDFVPMLRMIAQDALETLLSEGSIQVMSSFGDSFPKRANYREIARCGVSCICAAGHPLAGEEELTVKQLRQAERVAVCRPQISPKAVAEIQALIMSGRDSSQIIFCDSVDILCTMVETGFACAVLADLPQARLPGLSYIPVPEAETISFGVAYLAEENSPLLRRFLTLLEELAANGEKRRKSI